MNPEPSPTPFRPQRLLEHELAAATGLGGRDRAAVTQAERARIAVTKAIRTAEVTRIPILAASTASDAGKASPAMKIDTVKPTPPSPATRRAGRG